MPTKKKSSTKTPLTLFPRPPSPPKKTKKNKKRSKSLNPELPVTASVKPKKKTQPTEPSANVAQKQELLAVTEIDEQETSQMWILRHLRLKLEDIDDSVLTDFIHQQDVTLFRDFMLHATSEKRCIFIIVSRNQPQLMIPDNFFNFVNQEDDTMTQVIPDSERTENSLPKTLQKAPSVPTVDVKNKIKMMKPKKKTKKSRHSVSPSKIKNLSDKLKKNEEKEKNQLRAKEEIINEIIKNEVIHDDSEIQLKWSVNRKIPEEREFVFILPRDKEKLNEKSELDQSYYVGHVKNSQVFKKVIEIGRLVIGEKMTFERQMDMILYGLNVEQNDVINQREKWQNKNEKFENFILDVISNGYWQTTIGISRSESILSLSDQKSAVESVESLLKPRIHAFLKEPNTKTRIQLWLELSLYQLKFVSIDDDSNDLEDKMLRILTILQTLNLLITESHLSKEWLQKALFYTIELVARLLGTSLKLSVEILTSDLFDDIDILTDDNGNETRDKLKPIFNKMLDMGVMSMYNENSEEYQLLENIRQCLKIFEYIEEELDKMKTHVNYLRDPKHDMLIDRSPINESSEILRKIWDLFQETYFESALESGNNESMKSVCLKISSFQERLKEIVLILNQGD